MIDYMLKFESKEQAETVLQGIGVLFEHEGRMVPAQRHNVDVIGVISKPDGTFTEHEGIQYPNQVELEGYHINLRTTETFEALQEYTVTPTNPVRVWA